MKSSLIALFSACLFLLGLSYLYYPELVLKINAYLKEKLFNEQRIALNRKKFGVIYILASFVLVYAGIIIPRMTNISNELTIKNKINLSWYYYYKGRYSEAEQASMSVLGMDVNNQAALEQMCYIKFAAGDYGKARLYCVKVFAKDPDNERLKDIYDALMQKKKK